MEREKRKRSKEDRERESDQEGIWDRKEGKKRKLLIKEGIERRRRRSLGRDGFFEDQSSRLLGLVFCLFD